MDRWSKKPDDCRLIILCAGPKAELGGFAKAWQEAGGDLELSVRRLTPRSAIDRTGGDQCQAHRPVDRLPAYSLLNWCLERQTHWRVFYRRAAKEAPAFKGNWLENSCPGECEMGVPPMSRSAPCLIGADEERLLLPLRADEISSPSAASRGLRSGPVVTPQFHEAVPAVRPARRDRDPSGG